MPQKHVSPDRKAMDEFKTTLFALGFFPVSRFQIGSPHTDLQYFEIWHGPECRSLILASMGRRGFEVYRPLTQRNQITALSTAAIRYRNGD